MSKITYYRCNRCESVLHEEMKTGPINVELIGSHSALRRWKLMEFDSHLCEACLNKIQDIITAAVETFNKGNK